VWCKKLDISENTSVIPWKFVNVVLEKVGEDQMDRLSEKLWKWSIPNSHERKRILDTLTSRRLTGSVTSCCYSVIEGKIVGTRRRARRPSKLLDDLEETRRYWKWLEKALDRSRWRTRLGEGFAPVVRQTTEWYLACSAIDMKINKSEHICVGIDLQRRTLCMCVFVNTM